MRSTVLSMRLLIISVVLPAVVVGLDQLALRLGAAGDWSPAVGVAVTGLFVVQTALICFLAGSLPTWKWRFLLLGWSILLVNLLLAAGVSVKQWDRELGSAFLSAQIGALSAWLVLGSSSPRNRLTVVLLAAIPVAQLYGSLDIGLATISWGDPWSVIVAVQVGGTATVVTLLRVVGYRIEPEPQGAATTGGPVQFSIRHMMIATTFVAVLVPAVQWLLRSSSPWRGAAMWLQATADGAALALVSLTALWAAIGRGRWTEKSLVFVLVAVVAALGLYWLEITAQYSVGYGCRTYQLTYLGWRWIAWALLSGSLLGGMLLVLRATNFRLIRQRRALIETPQNPLA
jgi:hypothetical protein